MTHPDVAAILAHHVFDHGSTRIDTHGASSRIPGTPRDGHALPYPRSSVLIRGKGKGVPAG
ncbi:MAG TPA: hypothetical protein VM619_04870 [Luteimonas sp.]|nr:hypothetical protein [Luteimonas sp.]